MRGELTQSVKLTEFNEQVSIPVGSVEQEVQIEGWRANQTFFVVDTTAELISRPLTFASMGLSLDCGRSLLKGDRGMVVHFNVVLPIKGNA